MIEELKRQKALAVNLCKKRLDLVIETERKLNKEKNKWEKFRK